MYPLSCTITHLLHFQPGFRSCHRVKSAFVRVPFELLLTIFFFHRDDYSVVLLSVLSPASDTLRLTVLWHCLGTAIGLKGIVQPKLIITICYSPLCWRRPFSNPHNRFWVLQMEKNSIQWRPLVAFNSKENKKNPSKIKDKKDITCLHNAPVVSSKCPDEAAVQFVSKWRRATTAQISTGAS